MSMRTFSVPVWVATVGLAMVAVGQAPIVRQAPPRHGPVRQAPAAAGACTVDQAMQAEQRQDWNGAIKVYQCLSAADPKDWRPVNSIAGVYGVMNQPAQEAQWAQKAIGLAPQQPEPYLNLGNAQAMQKNLPGAQATFLKASQVAPTSPLPPYSLGELAASQQNAVDAEKWYRKALAIDPKFEDASVSLAALYGNTGRVQQAIPILQGVVQADPQAEDAKQMLYDMQHGGPKQPAQGGSGPQQGAPVRQ